MSQQDTNYPFIALHIQQDQEEVNMDREILPLESTIDPQEITHQSDGRSMSFTKSLNESTPSRWNVVMVVGSRRLLFVTLLLTLISQCGILDQEQLIQLWRYLVFL